MAGKETVAHFVEKSEQVPHGPTRGWFPSKDALKGFQSNLIGYPRSGLGVPPMTVSSPTEVAILMHSYLNTFLLSVAEESPVIVPGRVNFCVLHGTSYDAMYRYSWKGFQICIRHLNQLLYIKTTEISQIASKRPIVSLGTSAAGKTVRCTITSNGTLFRAPFAPLLWRHCHSTNSKPKEGTSRAGPDHISAQIKEQLTWSGLAHSVLLQGRQPSKSADSQGRIGAMKRSGEVSGSSKKKKVVSPVTIYRKAIQQAASQGDVRTAFKTFDEAKNEGVKLTPDCFITLLFLASGGDSWERYVPGYNRVEKAGGSEDAFKDYMSRCDDILDDMKREGYAAVEMCYTALARRDAVLGHADAAFQRALLVEEEGLTPRLRCYLPALTAYAAKGDAKGAYNTYCTFLRSGLEPTETEFEKLVDALGRDNGEEDTVSWSVVTAVLNHMASETTVLQNSTITSLEQLFKSRRAKRALKKGTEWKVEMAQVTDEGYCASCDDHLEAIDLTKEEYAEFANGIAALAAKQEKHPNDFKKV